MSTGDLYANKSSKCTTSSASIKRKRTQGEEDDLVKTDTDSSMLVPGPGIVWVSSKGVVIQ